MADNDSQAKEQPPSIPDHTLLRRIGSGSYGEVWLAQSILNQYRAIKVVRRDKFEESRPFDREFSGIQKYEPISRSHEGLVSIFHVGKNAEGGFFYYIMELADDLTQTGSIVSDSYVPRTVGRELRNRGRFTTEECVRIGIALCGALTHLHKNGLVHRDIKPSNIIFVSGKPKLADIGLVAAFDESKSFVGTEGFVPPEGPGTTRADVYALGKVLYEMSTGNDRQDFPELPSDLAERSDRQLWVGLNRILLKACHSDVKKGYASTQELQEDLKRLLDGRPPKPEPLSQNRKVLVTTGALLVLAVTVGFLALQNSKSEKPSKPPQPPVPIFEGPLQPPSELIPFPVSSSTINLLWTDNSDNEDGFLVERRRTELGEWVEIASVAQNITWFQDHGMDGNVSYFYRVRAFNASGKSAPSPQANANTYGQPLKNVARAAQGASASADSVGSYIGYVGLAERAIDGDPGRGWTGTQVPGWLNVKLDRVYRVEKIGIWFGGHKHRYSVSTSVDGSAWTVVIAPRDTTNKQNGPPAYEIFAITPIEVRFVRIEISETSAPASHIFQAIVQELEAYASSTSQRTTHK